MAERRTFSNGWTIRL